MSGDSLPKGISPELQARITALPAHKRAALLAKLGAEGHGAGVARPASQPESSREAGSAQTVQAQSTDGDQACAARGGSEKLALTAAQERLLFLQEYEGSNPAYHIQFALLLEGDLRPGHLKTALAEVEADGFAVEEAQV